MPCTFLSPLRKPSTINSLNSTCGVPNAASDPSVASVVPIKEYWLYGMASEKRKRARGPESDRAEKKPKASKPTSRLTGPKEEPAFQRGGASILTPLEQKQIQVQATRDALFEQSTGQKARNTEYGDDENEEEVHVEPTAAPANTKRKRTVRRDRDEPSASLKGSGVRIEGLSYRVRSFNSRMEPLIDIWIAACTWFSGTRTDF